MGGASQIERWEIGRIRGGWLERERPGIAGESTATLSSLLNPVKCLNPSTFFSCQVWEGSPIVIIYPKTKFIIKELLALGLLHQ
jgi:hypothetical protein